MNINRTILLFAIALGIVAGLQIGISTEPPLSWLGWAIAAILTIVTVAIGGPWQRPQGTRIRVIATLILAALGVTLLIAREARTELALIALPVAVIIIVLFAWRTPRQTS